MNAFRNVILAVIFAILAVLIGTDSFRTDAGGPPHGGGLPMMIIYLFPRLMAGLQNTLGQTQTVGLFAILALINAAIAARAFIESLQVESANQPGAKS